MIVPAVSQRGYVALRADQISEPGIITSQVIQHIVDDPLVVADLTERNPNVFYELAIRHAIRKPLIQVIRTGDEIPFDVAGTRTIRIDHRDLDSVEFAKQQVVEQMDWLERNSSNMETPISVALDLKLLRQSGNPEHRSLEQIVTLISDMRGGMGSVQHDIGKVGEALLRIVLMLDGLRAPVERSAAERVQLDLLDAIRAARRECVNADFDEVLATAERAVIAERAGSK